MRVFCEKCKTEVDACIDTQTLENKAVGKNTKAICTDCKSALPLTQFALKSLFSMRKFFTAKPTQAFQYKCDTCRDYTEAELSPNGKEAQCKTCKSAFKITPFMLTAFKLSKGKKGLDE